jgi:hypothetical protein
MNKSRSSGPKTSTKMQERQHNVAKLGPDIKAKIGQQLRVMYTEVVAQGIPDRFVEILRGLDEATEPNGSQNGHSDQ